LFFVAGLGYLPDKIIITVFILMAAVGAIGVEAVADESVTGSDDI
jgi:hypothetical protein